MILVINKKEGAALTMHMAVMRKSFRNLLKSKYKDKQREYLIAYDYVQNEAQAILELDLESHSMHLNIIDLTVLEAFLKAYSDKLEQELKSKMNNEQISAIEDLSILKDLQQRCEEVMAA